MRKRRVLRWPVVLRWRAWVVIHSELLWRSLSQQPPAPTGPYFVAVQRKLPGFVYAKRYETGGLAPLR